MTRVGFSFDWPVAIAHLHQADPRLSAVVTQVGEITIALEPQGFTALVDAIVSQQLSIKAAATIFRRLQIAVGILSPETLLQQTPEQLRELGLSRQKSAYLLDLAARVQQGSLDLGALDRMDDEEVIAQLTQVKGIGRWTAEMYLMFRLGRPDVLPVGDLGLQQAVQRLYQLTDPPKPAFFRELAQPWQPYRSVACWYLWRSLDLQSR